MNKSKINFKKIIYPGALVVIIIAIATSMFLTIKSITGNINAAFDINESAVKISMVRIDMESYKLAAKKLNIQPATPQSLETEEQ